MMAASIKIKRSYSRLIKILLEYLKDNINPSTVNAIHCDFPTLASIQGELLSVFPSIKFRHTQKFLTDITNVNDQLEIVTVEHNRAHRSLKENFLQILSEYYFPNIKKLLKCVIANCRICRENKYQRQPTRVAIAATPIPEFPGEILHVDILITAKQHFLTCVDKFSKFATVIPITSRSAVDIRTALLQILSKFKKTQLLVSDNEKAFQSSIISTFLRDNFSIEQFFVPPMHSKSNGQVERLHSTLLEIARCVKAQQNIDDAIDLILFSVLKYNNTIHSVTGEKPIDILNNLEKDKILEIKQKLVLAQERSISHSSMNAVRKTYNPGDVVFVRRNQRLGNKFDKIFVQQTVEQDMGTTVLINGREVHKDNLR